MKFLKLLLDFYINSSIHVALAVFSFVRMTQYMVKIPYENSVVYFAFFGTIVGYNFVKYNSLVHEQKFRLRIELKCILVLSLFSFIATGYFYLQLQRITQIIALIFFGVTLLYTLPFFPNRSNARNWAGIKIYIVALSWVGVTLFLPIVNSGINFTQILFPFALQRFTILFVLILIFEIIDLKNDNPNLETVPQQIGVLNTKRIGSLLLVFFLLLEFINHDSNLKVLLLKVGIAVTSFLFLWFANQKKSKYYTNFWVESIPVIWWLLLLFFS